MPLLVRWFRIGEARTLSRMVRACLANPTLWRSNPSPAQFGRYRTQERVQAGCDCRDGPARRMPPRTWKLFGGGSTSPAATAAEKSGGLNQQERSLNNLGEALRALGRDEEAVHAFRDSEKISLVGGQPESAISTGHNRALALESLGRFEESRRVFRRCFDDSAKHRFWYEHVRATEGLANIAWAQSKPATALRLYRLAMREARKRGISALEP